MKKKHEDDEQWRYYVSGIEGTVPWRYRLGRPERWDLRTGRWVEDVDGFFRKFATGDGFLTVVEPEELPEAARP